MKLVVLGLSLSSSWGNGHATTFRALQTLQGHGMVEVEEPGQLWHIGAGAFRIGTAFLRRTKVVERARAPMDQLMRDTGETSNLGVEVGDEVLFLSQVETYQAIRAFFPPGTKAPMHVSGIGKALLAWYPETRVKAILAARGLERFTSLTNLVTLPGYTTLDAALQYTLGQWDVDVNIKNLANRKYYVSAHGSNDNLILPGSPRAVQVTLRTRF